MKKITQFGVSILFALFTMCSFAEENTSQPSQPLSQETQTTQKTEVTALNPNLVNLNTASAAELQDKLVGIGAKKAQAIVDYREKNGKFINLEQLTEVSGIGKATLEKNRERIVLE